MGQTLTHGVYLPDEGERNCYNGLASNWSILDGAVGTIAEHTTALAGKAPAVHTHTKSDITDFPAYGNAAGTICEGNDSRLSDARTPVSHTHGNVTNDGKLATANRVLITDGNKVISLSGVTDTELGYLSGVTSAIQTQLNAKAADIDVVHKSRNESISGVKTFLDTNIRFNASRYVSGTPSNNIFYAPILIGGVVNNADKNTFQHNAAIRTTGINDYSIRVFSQTSDTLTGVVAETNADASDVSFRPIANGTHNLGTSSYKWKSFNGINPGALSLPVTALNNTYDISGNITDLTGGNNSITAARTGWIFVKSDNATEISIENTTTGMGASDHSASAATLMVSIPVTSGETVNIIANCTSIDKAYLLPCQGNV